MCGGVRGVVEGAHWGCDGAPIAPTSSGPGPRHYDYYYYEYLLLQATILAGVVNGRTRTLRAGY